MVQDVVLKNIPEKKVYSKSYSQFIGVDFATEPSKVSDNRSPDSLNMLSESGGVVKRLGWRVLAVFPGRINGIFAYAEGAYLVHAGTSLYRWAGDGTQGTSVYSGANDSRSVGLSFGGKLYILTGGEYLVYDGDEVQPVAGAAYIPFTASSGIDAGGTPANNLPCHTGDSLNDVNMLTSQRRNSFITRTWSVSSTAYGNHILYLDGVASSIDEVLYKGQVYSPSLYVLQHYKYVNGVITTAANIEEADFSAVARNTGYFPSTDGRPDLEVTFTSYKGNTADRIENCSIMSIYSNRIFFAGNPEFPNADFASELNDPSYIPDRGYTEIGNDNSAIMGYLRIGDYQAIVKEENAQDASIFLRSSTLTEKDMIFPIKQGVSGNGAVSRYCFASLVDDPLFLTRTGVYAIASQTVTAERTIQARSSRVNPRLEKEEGLDMAQACEWNGYYLLTVNGRAYIADSRHKSYAGNTTASFEYEWFFWDNIPARVLFENRGSLFFGTESGAVCRLNNDLLLSDGGYLANAYSDGYRIGKEEEGVCPILAYWMTPKSDDGSFMTYKTMIKKGCGLYLKTYTHSSVDIWVITDKDFGKLIRRANAGIFDFNNLDFESFTFNTLPQMIVPFNTKVKKYKIIQFCVKNEVLDETIGLYALEKKYTIGNYVKK